ncbi:hypothetical protein HHI36_008096 [Cryptolaemus montrouzieri]|uniref:Antigen KI-67 n=1 Tax=Cryptolaemus montrouzieri TaxID=559131 RepID=A0ABD2MRJ2_9CUCU
MAYARGENVEGFLYFYRKNGLSDPYRLNFGKTTLGSSLECNIRVKGEEDILCVLDSNEVGVTILVNEHEDERIKINGSVATKITVLKDGDHFYVGSKKFKYSNPTLKKEDMKLVIQNVCHEIAGASIRRKSDRKSINISPVKRLLRGVSSRKRRFSTGSRIMEVIEIPKIAERNLLISGCTSTPLNRSKMRFSQRINNTKSSPLEILKENDAVKFQSSNVNFVASPIRTPKVLSNSAESKKREELDQSRKKNKSFTYNLKEVDLNLTDNSCVSPSSVNRKMYSGNISDASEITTPENIVSAVSITPLNVSKKTNKSLNKNKTLALVDVKDESSTPKSAMKGNRASSIYRPVAEDITPVSLLQRSSLRISTLKKPAFSQRRSVNFMVSSSSECSSLENPIIWEGEESSKLRGNKRKESLSDALGLIKRKKVENTSKNSIGPMDKYDSNLLGINWTSDLSLDVSNGESPYSKSGNAKISRRISTLSGSVPDTRNTSKLSDYESQLFFDNKSIRRVSVASTSKRDVTFDSCKVQLSNRSIDILGLANDDSDFGTSLKTVSLTPIAKPPSTRKSVRESKHGDLALEDCKKSSILFSARRNSVNSFENEDAGQTSLFQGEDISDANPNDVSLNSFSEILNSHDQKLCQQQALRKLNVSNYISTTRRSSCATANSSNSMNFQVEPNSTLDETHSLSSSRRSSNKNDKLKVLVDSKEIEAASTLIYPSFYLEQTVENDGFHSTKDVINPDDNPDANIMQKVVSSTPRVEKATNKVSQSQPPESFYSPINSSLSIKPKSSSICVVKKRKSVLYSRLSECSSRNVPTNHHRNSLGPNKTLNPSIDEKNIYDLPNRSLRHSKTVQNSPKKSSSNMANSEQQYQILSSSIENSLVSNNSSTFGESEKRTPNIVEARLSRRSLRNSSMPQFNPSSSVISTDSSISEKSQINSCRNTIIKEKCINTDFSSCFNQSDKSDVRTLRTNKHSSTLDSAKKNTRAKHNKFQPTVCKGMTSTDSLVSNKSMRSSPVAHTKTSSSFGKTFTSNLSILSSGSSSQANLTTQSFHTLIQTSPALSNSSNPITFSYIDSSADSSILENVTYSIRRSIRKTRPSLDENMYELSKSRNVRPPNKSMKINDIYKSGKSPKKMKSPVIEDLDNLFKIHTTKKSPIKSSRVSEERLNDVQKVEMLFNKQLVESKIPQKSSKLTDSTSERKTSSVQIQNFSKNDGIEMLGVENLLKSPKHRNSPKNICRDFVGVKKLLNSPKVQNSNTKVLTKVLGIKKLMSTLQEQKSSKNDLRNIVGVERLLRTPKIQLPPKNDLTEVVGIKKLMSTPKGQKSPKNDLRNIVGVKRLLRTPKIQLPPKNDLTKVVGIRKLMSTPKEPKSPKNDLRNIVGVKRLLRTPKIQLPPKNDLTKVVGIKKLMSTPQEQKSPKNDLRNIVSIKRLLRTPKIQFSPTNDLNKIVGIKKLMSTPKEPKPPKNDLRNVVGVKRLLRTPKIQYSPKNDLTEVEGLKKLLATPAKLKSPINDFSDVGGLKELMRTPREHSVSKNDFSDLRGVKNLLRAPKNESSNYDIDLSGVKDLFDESKRFDSLLEEKPPKTYRRSPKKNHQLPEEKIVIPEIKEHVLEWIKQQSKVEKKLTSKKESMNSRRKINGTEEVLTEKGMSNIKVDDDYKIVKPEVVRTRRGMKQLYDPAEELGVISCLNEKSSTPVIVLTRSKRNLHIKESSATEIDIYSTVVDGKYRKKKTNEEFEKELSEESKENHSPKNSKSKVKHNTKIHNTSMEPEDSYIRKTKLTRSRRNMKPQDSEEERIFDGSASKINQRSKANIIEKQDSTIDTITDFSKDRTARRNKRKREPEIVKTIEHTDIFSLEIKKNKRLKQKVLDKETSIELNDSSVVVPKTTKSRRNVKAREFEQERIFLTTKINERPEHETNIIAKHHSIDTTIENLSISKVKATRKNKRKQQREIVKIIEDTDRFSVDVEVKSERTRNRELANETSINSDVSSNVKSKATRSRRNVKIQQSEKETILNKSACAKDLRSDSRERATRRNRRKHEPEIVKKKNKEQKVTSQQNGKSKSKSGSIEDSRSRTAKNNIRSENNDPTILRGKGKTNENDKAEVVEEIAKQITKRDRSKRKQDEESSHAGVTKVTRGRNVGIESSTIEYSPVKTSNSNKNETKIKSNEVENINNTEADISPKPNVRSNKGMNKNMILKNGILLQNHQYENLKMRLKTSFI